MATTGQKHTSQQARPLKFIELDTGCYVCVSHKQNADGYFRKAWGNQRSGDKKIEMFHRVLWEAKVGEIPDGYEINHKCGNRACQNVEHMECIPGEDHAILTNKERYQSSKAEAYEYWRRTECTGVALSEEFGVTPDSAWAWIREWKK